jgi:hypothetical protein
LIGSLILEIKKGHRHFQFKEITPVCNKACTLLWDNLEVLLRLNAETEAHVFPDAPWKISAKTISLL